MATLIGMANNRTMWDLTVSRTTEAMRLHVDEIRRHSSYAEISIRNMQDAYAETEHTSSAFDRFFVAGQAFMSSAAMISKILWPTPLPKKPKPADRRRVERGDLLRSELSVPESSPLKVRTLRNSFEHADERLDEVGRRQQDAIILNSSMLGHDDAIQNLGSVPIIYLRVFTEDRQALRMFDAEVSLPDYMKAVVDMSIAANQWLIENPDTRIHVTS